jgi:hypothetical protein
MAWAWQSGAEKVSGTDADAAHNIDRLARGEPLQHVIHVG